MSNFAIAGNHRPAVLWTSAKGEQHTAPGAASSPKLLTPLPPRQAPIALSAQRATRAAPLLRPTVARDVRTPAFDLRAAVEASSFAAKNPLSLHVPDELLSRLDHANSLLLIGHISPDGDCVGSTLSVARAFEKLGKRVDVCIDDALYGSLRNIDSEHTIRRAKDLLGKKWDLALILDVGVPERIGKANDLLLENAGAVAIADHHVVEPKREQFNLAPSAPFLTWIEEDHPAASLQAAAILARYDDRLRQAGADMKAVYTPAMLGFCTDTGWGRFQGLDREYFRYFKYMLKNDADSTLDELEQTLHYEVPGVLLDVLLSGKAPSTLDITEPFRSKLQAQVDAGQNVTQARYLSPSGNAGISVIRMPAAHTQLLLDLGRQSDPRLIPSDVINIVKFNRLRKLLDQGAAIAVMLIEDDDGTISVSIRGVDKHARKLAEHLGGGGHDRAAGASLANQSLAEVEQTIVAWGRDHGVVA